MATWDSPRRFRAKGICYSGFRHDHEESQGINRTCSLSQGVFLPLISDHGQTLVLVGVGSAMKFGDQKVMWIYRQQGNSAKLVRAVPLSDVWTHEEIESDAVVGDMGELPMWYTGGSLEFSPDDRVLLYRSRWNDRVKIKLADGSTTFEHK
jgi:hypothetical protein